MNGPLEVDGQLIADGVTFTSAQEYPAAGDWYGIEFRTASNDKPSSLTNCTIEFAEYGLIFQDTTAVTTHPVEITGCTIRNILTAGIQITGNAPVISGCTIMQTGSYIGQGFGIYCVRDPMVTIEGCEICFFDTGVRGYNSGSGGYPTIAISGCTIRDNTNYGIWLRADDTDHYGPVAVINNNSIYDNASYNLYAGAYRDAATTVIDAENNWWGTADSLEIEDGIYDYKENRSCPVVDFSPFLDGPGGDPAAG